MKTSIIEVREMLSVLTVDEVEKRFVDVPGVKSATANYAAGTATVRYDETRLQAADIKAIVHQRGMQPAGKSAPRHAGKRKAAPRSAAVPTPQAAPALVSTPGAVVPKAAPVAPVAPTGDGAKGKVAPVAQPAMPAAAPPKALAVAPAAPPAPPAPAGGPSTPA